MAVASRSGPLPSVIIVGAGAAGIFTAYQINKHWPGQFDVQLFEASPVVGGNVSSLSVDYGGQSYAIDAGAQFFYGKAQPLYVGLIHDLGLDDRVATYPAGVTIWERSTNQRRLWIPSTVGGFARYTLEDWKRLVEFGVFLTAATLLNRVGKPDWTLSVDDWLKIVPLDDDVKQNVVKNFLYQFLSLPYDRIGEASAVYATTYFVRNVIGGPPTAARGADIPTFQTNQSLVGLLGILERALDASAAEVMANSPVTAVAPGADGVAVTVGGRVTTAKYVILACDPGAAAALLANGGTADRDLVALLSGMADQYLKLSIVMQKDGACWMPGDSSYWEAVSTVVDTPRQSVAFNAWFGPLRPTYGDDQRVPVFKSWGSPGLDAQSCGDAFFSHVHNVMLPTTTFMQLRSQLDQHQQRNGLAFAGGWSVWFDSQEAALMSAMRAVQMLQPSDKTQHLPGLADVPDPGVIAGQVRSWIEMVLSRAPQSFTGKLSELVRQLG